MLSTAISCGFLLAAGAMPAFADEGVTTKPDIAYARRPGGELKLDIVAPKEGDGPFPAVLCIHGGAWRAGNKADVRLFMERLAKDGYVAISPQYRFCPKETFPAQVHDVKEAVRWVRTHASEYKIDPERIGAIGFSAGGHLALMLGVTGPKDGLEGEGVAEGAPPTKIKAVVNYFGPTELAADDIPDVSKPLVKDFLGGTPKEKAELCAQASPLTFVTADDAPILTFQGTRDPLVPHSQAIKLGEKMTEVGLPGRVELLIGGGHGWAGAELERTVEMSLEFFDLHLKGEAIKK